MSVFNVAILFEFLMCVGIEFHSFSLDTGTAFCPIAVLR